MKRKVLIVFFVLFVLAGMVCAETLSIYDIQYTTDPNGASPLNGSIVDCNGGIVIHKWTGGRTRLVLFDPNYPDSWGGIMVKDTYSAGYFTDVNVGDRLSLTNVKVEDFKGTTFLQFISANDPNYTIVSRNNPLPKPLPVSVSQVPAPVKVEVDGIDRWVVADHNCEKYEAMLIKVIDVNVLELGKGKAYDNYVLQSNTDSNCWASDYMNKNKVGKYDPVVEVGREFCGVTGILEQYEGWSDETTYYDYYQLLTTDTNDFTITQTADLDDDCDVDFVDYRHFAVHWLALGCTEPDWCGGADITENGSVDELDLEKFVENWLEGISN